MKVHGRCHCGAISYEGEVEASSVNICHCLDCQTLSGAAFRVNVHAPAASFRVLSGEPKRYIKTGSSGTRREHAFCGTCGSPIYSADPESPKAYTLRIGALSEREQLGPVKRQIWTKRRVSWLPKPESKEDFEAQP